MGMFFNFPSNLEICGVLFMLLFGTPQAFLPGFCLPLNAGAQDVVWLLQQLIQRWFYSGYRCWS